MKKKTNKILARSPTVTSALGIITGNSFRNKQLENNEGYCSVGKTVTPEKAGPMMNPVVPVIVKMAIPSAWLESSRYWYAIDWLILRAPKQQP